MGFGLEVELGWARFFKKDVLDGLVYLFFSSSMPQIQLPIFPEGTTLITTELAFERRGNQVVYFNGHLPVFTHEVADIASFRFFTTQLIVNGTALQADVVRAFGVPSVTVKRYVKKYREGGSRVFFAPSPRREGHKLTSKRLIQVQSLLDQGQGIPAISATVDVLATTIHKAIASGRLRAPEKKTKFQPS